MVDRDIPFLGAVIDAFVDPFVDPFIYSNKQKEHLCGFFDKIDQQISKTYFDTKPLKSIMSIVSSMEPTQLLHRVLVFDVETTGLIPKLQNKNQQKQVGQELGQDQNPHILQLSFVIFDTQFWRVVTSYDAYIKVDHDIAITPIITELTGITRAMCEERGVPIADAMREFHDAYMSCDAVVAHNLDFDREMVRIEMGRLQNLPVFDPVFEQKLNKQLYCTMRMGKTVCRIERIDRFGQTYFKSPKLVELYEHLFSEPAPDGLHNSLIDTYVCLRCFVRLRFRFDLRKTAFPMTLFSACSSSVPSIDFPVMM